MFSKNMFKRFVLVALVLLLSVSFFACNQEEEVVETTAPPTTTAPVLQKIGVLSYALDENFSEVYSGFLDALEASGYKDGETFELISYECESEEALEKASAELSDADTKLIFAIGADAAKAAKNATTEIPVVFSCVEDPIGEGLLKSCEKPEGNITGVCDYTPVFEQIELIITLYPDTEKIACVYNGADEDSILTANIAAGEAQFNDVTFTQYPALTEGEYEFEMEKALEKCDVLYLAEDALTNACLEDTLKSAKDKKIPVFAETSALVESGCLATCIKDYERMGYTAGELSVILLRSIKPVSDVPVEYASDCIPVLNDKVQKVLKLTLPQDIADKAVVISVSN